MPLPPFDPSGRLPPGTHWATWGDIAGRFGGGTHRQQLLEGLRLVCENLRQAGCPTVFIDGSFVTAKARPADFDGCWDPVGVNFDHIDPVLLDFTDRRAAQKERYGGEMFVAGASADHLGNTFLEFFQIDKETGDGKGIVALDLRSEP
ncbi:MAG TPA: hypothetical protein VJP07_07180 [Dehalococcoidia bacterium]|nr:hypothetical protein [Dehalococcoidia bacterium]